MKIEVNDKGDIILKEVYSGIGLETKDGEFIGICMRDSGFEFNYNGVWYEAKDNKITKMKSDIEDTVKNNHTN